MGTYHSGLPIETRPGVFLQVKHDGAVVATGVCLFVFQAAEGCMKVGEKAVCVIHIMYIYISILYTYTK